MIVDSVLFYYILLVFSIAILYLLCRPLLNRFFYRIKLENEFLDFLSLLITLESSGLRLDNVFEEASRNRLVIPSSYARLAREYTLLSRVNPDPYTCLRMLSRRIPSQRIASFIRGYSEVLISSNDTLSYVESFLKEEFNGLKSRIEHYSIMLDNLFESYMVVLLGLLVYSLLPLTPIPPLLIGFLLMMITGFAFYIVYRLSSLAMFHNSYLVLIPTLILVFTTPLLLVLPYQFIVLHLLVTIIIGSILYIVTNGFLSVEESTFNLLEELYASVRQGLPMDHAMIRMGSRHGYPVDMIVEMLRLGFKPIEIVRVLRLPPLSKRIVGLVLAPIEYSRGFPGYLGYILGVVDGIRGLRRVLSERGRIYYVYVLLIMVVVYVMVRIFNNLGMLEGFDTGFVKNLSYVSIFESLIIASIISRGYWFRSIATYLLLVAMVFTIYYVI